MRCGHRLLMRLLIAEYTPAMGDIEIVSAGGVSFEVADGAGMAKLRNTPDHFILPKSTSMVERYLELSSQLGDGARIVEIGVYQGASTAFLLKQFASSRVLAVELRRRGSDAFEQFLERNVEEASRLKVMWGVDQSDTDAIGAEVERFHGGESIDLVIDDASHLYEPTKATFELLFAQLRPGGSYVIEDWRWEHVAETYADLSEEELEQTVLIRAMVARVASVVTPLSRLVMEIAMLCACRPDLVERVLLSDGIVEVVRGAGDLDRSGFNISELLGAFAERSLNGDGG